MDDDTCFPCFTQTPMTSNDIDRSFHTGLRQQSNTLFTLRTRRKAVLLVESLSGRRSILDHGQKSQRPGKHRQLLNLHTH
jgi:hypothetical protein